MARLTVSGVPDGFTEARFDAGSVQLNHVRGPANGPPLVLVPGVAEAWQGYKPVLAELAERFEVFAVDVRGHGKSSRTPDLYHYHRIGEDLRRFIRGVIGGPAIVAGLATGGVVALWLGAYARGEVSAVVAEDPPLFAAVLPRILREQHLSRSSRLAVETIHGEPPRDLRNYFSAIAIRGKRGGELHGIPKRILTTRLGLYDWQRSRRPDAPYDAPLLPYAIRSRLQGLSEYDTDFSAAIVDGTLGIGLDVEEMLQRVNPPVLLMKAIADFHPELGLMGAMSEEDLERVEELVYDVRVVRVACRHEIHQLRPREYTRELMGFVDDLRAERKL